MDVNGITRFVTQESQASTPQQQQQDAEILPSFSTASFTPTTQSKDDLGVIELDRIDDILRCRKRLPTGFGCGCLQHDANGVKSRYQSILGNILADDTPVATAIIDILGANSRSGTYS